MSGTHGVFQHVSGYFYTMLEEDFCEVYKAEGKNEVCRAYITSILEHLTNKQYEATGSDTDIWVFMSLPEMSRRMRHAFGERTIHKEIQGMIADGYLFKRRAYGKATMEYRLNLRKLRKALEALPEKQPCNNATYHLANLQDQPGIIARSTLQNSKNNLAELQPRITIEETLEVPENKEESSVSADASTPPAFYSSQEIPVTYNEALAYLKPHGPHEGLDAVQVLKLAQKLWAEAHEEDELPNETTYHIADSTIRDDVEEDAPTVKMPAIKLNGATHGSTHTELSSGRDRGNTGDGGILRAAGRSMGQAEGAALDTATGSQALQVQPQTQEIDPQQTPGPGALPPSAEPPQFGGSHGITSDQALSSLLLDPEPAQSSPPTGSTSTTRTAQATGERGKPEKPVQQALGTTTEGNIAQERTQEKPKRGRKGKEAVEELPAEVIQLLDDWDSLHRAPLPRTDRLIALAKAGVQAEITHEELKGCRNWLPTTDRPGKPYYRHKGVGLWDIIDKIGEYRSLQNMPIPGVPLADTKKRDPNEPELGVSGLPKWKGPMPVYD